MTTQNLDRLELWIRAGLVLATVALIFTIVRSSSAGVARISVPDSGLIESDLLDDVPAL